MPGYKHFPFLSIDCEEYSLVPIREHDLYAIMDWRNAQIDILRQKELLTAEKQHRYFKEVIEPSFAQQFPKQILFSYLRNGICIGYGGLVHFSWEDKRAEVSFVLDDKRIHDHQSYRKDFLFFLRMLKFISFSKLGLNRIFTETYDIRDYHIQVIEDAGFLREGSMREHVYIKSRAVDSILHGCILSDYEEARESDGIICQNQQ